MFAIRSDTVLFYPTVFPTNINNGNEKMDREL
jgi:hypothetical protein